MIGWAAAATVELWLGHGLRAPPSLLGAGAELGGLALIALVHARACAARPNTALALPELPGLALACAWLTAASLRPDTVAWGGAPDSGGALAILGALGAITALLLLAAQLPLGASRRAGPRAVAGGAVGAFVGLFAAGLSDPTFFPSTATLPDLWFAMLEGALVAIVLAGGSALRRGWVLFPMAAVLAAMPVPSTQTPPRSAPLILLLTVDTLRADAASTLGSFDWLSQRGTRFSDSVSTSSWTVPSVASWLTGRWPAVHGAGRTGTGWPGLAGPDVRLPRLPERLAQQGWQTAAVLSNVFLVPALGFDRGFAEFGHADSRPDAPLLLPWLLNRTAAGAPHQHRNDVDELLDRARSWLSEHPSEPAFLWVHLLDPHLPYHHAELAPDNALFPYFGAHPHDALDSTFVRRGNLRDGPDERLAVRALYDDEVDRMDRSLLAFLEQLERDGSLQDATVLFTADHGEEFWEHGGFEHGHALWPEVTQVPMVLIGRGITAGAVRDDPVTGVDVGPTLLAAAGLAPQHAWDGLDLHGPVDANRVRRIEGTFYFGNQTAVLQQDYAWLSDEAGGALFHRVWDPAWRTDRSLALPEVAASLAAAAADLTIRTGAPATVDPDALRALGYAD